MISEEERNSIINEAVEQALLKIPEVVGNLMMSYASKAKSGEKFYEKYPEFNDHRELVAATIEKIESENPTQDLDKILEKAVPEARKRIKSIKGLDMQNVTKPDTNFGHGEL